ncbi:STAS domain-containing protein [Actinomadura sp. 21ATH]|uniref:STAS domain-containing protein n=1 Tax=Actinomadura sp. 21ATH TaxID=1735444 RepID=UPI0035C17147
MHTRRPSGHAATPTAVVLRHTDHTLVEVRGELDTATAPALREALFRALRPGTGPLILDLSGLSFCDAAGLSVLVDARLRADARGIVMLLAAPGPRLRALLRVTGLDRGLPLHRTVADARAQSPAPGATRGRPRAAFSALVTC